MRGSSSVKPSKPAGSAKSTRSARAATSPAGRPEEADLPYSTVADPPPPDRETPDTLRIRCPHCQQPIALLVGEEVLPEHARCPTPWNPFGLSVCAGSGHPAEEAAPFKERPQDEERGTMAVLLRLPEGLDWRRQPFSHVGGPGSRPMRLPRQAS